MMNQWRTQLRILRRYHGLKQSVLAEMIGVDQATISRWENGHQEPDLRGKRRMRDLLRKFSTRMEVEVGALLSSPIIDRSLVDTNYVLKDVSSFSVIKLGIEKSEIVGQNINRLRDDPEYERLVAQHKKIMSDGEFVCIRGVFLSKRNKCWIEAYTIPVLISGSVYFLSDRVRVRPEEQPRAKLEITLLDL